MYFRPETALMTESAPIADKAATCDDDMHISLSIGDFTHNVSTCWEEGYVTIMAVVESCVTISKYSAYSCDDTLSTMFPCRAHESSAANDRSDMMICFLTIFYDCLTPSHFVTAPRGISSLPGTGQKFFELFGLAKIRNLLALGLF
jgi:hypothetical protein